ncbi:hypothetical protein CSC2_16540 [Clostridium zeae]|uniref:RDD domain-containing protein n=1 Tax=Clostridium zeae TaxID=2759022 RepID=A0ABQ1E9E5_9CLOT|nr:RDD family protein [Clostridium zeae]GFZ31128.1 hypothetical protein CSC2_16540 [Clostridium zeae]
MLDKENINENEQKEEVNEVREDNNTAQDEAVIEQSTEDIVVREEKADEKPQKADKANFFVRLIGNLMDQTIVLAVAVVLYFIFSKGLPLAGYMIIEDTASKLGIFFIMYVISNVLLTSIIESTKLGTTFGKKLLRIK